MALSLVSTGFDCTKDVGRASLTRPSDEMGRTRGAFPTDTAFAAFATGCFAPAPAFFLLARAAVAAGAFFLLARAATLPANPLGFGGAFAFVAAAFATFGSAGVFLF